MSALDHVSDNGHTRANVEFSRSADGLEATGPYRAAIGFGDRLDVDAAAVRKALGVDLGTAQTAISAGTPPDEGTLLTGVDTSHLAAAARHLGAKSTKSGSTTTYRFRADNKIAVDDPLAKALGAGSSVLSGLDLVSVDGSDLSYGPNTAAVQAVSATSATLGDDPQIAAVAACLGDPLAAELTDARSAGLAASSGVAELGAAISGSNGKTPTETLCVATGSGENADRLATTIRRNARSGSSERSDQPWSDLLGNAHVTVPGGSRMVRLTATPRGRIAGVLFQALESRDLASLLGA